MGLNRELSSGSESDGQPDLVKGNTQYGSRK